MKNAFTSIICGAALALHAWLTGRLRQHNAIRIRLIILNPKERGA
ncbi:hypothetical protein [Paenibacillus macquariensis]|nr:hypothetical protein [Paenibacillus macquariensis]MEC0090581.1 hypothetical protein [Paenibacillus macquariensis]